ncbi:MAG: TIM-barrel domain-containing protein [Spirochaetota bacterium]
MHARSRYWFSLDDGPERVERSEGGSYRFTRGGLAVEASDDGWLRLRVSRSGEPVARRSWALDPDRDAKRRWSPGPGATFEHRPKETTRRVGGFVGVVEGEVNPHEDTRGLIEERTSATLVAFAPDSARPVPEVSLARSRDGIRVDLGLPGDSRVYGLGEKTGGLDKRGRTWAFWNSDDPEHIPGKDPLYQSIPVGYVVGTDGVTTVFSDSPATQYVDVGESAAGILRIEAYDEQVDLYLRVDATLPDAVRAYTGLTGRMALPPEWALGYQQCRYSYFPEARVLEVADRIRAERVPCDVIYLDIHYMNGYRVFTWDPDRFPDPKRMIDELHAGGFRLVTIVDPGVKVDPDYPVYGEGANRNLFLRRADGSVYVGKVWPGEAAFPDFSKSETRRWWAEQHRALFEPGVDGVWNDMNEPADFTGDPVYRPDFTVPDELVADNDDEPAAFGRLHNAYASGMNEATRAAFDSLRTHERGFVLTRAGYAGIQRRAAVWTGDNHSWWEHIALTIPMQLNLGLSGVAFCGADTGGFQGNARGELFARWVAASALMPFFRSHTALDTVDQEPWAFGPEVLHAVRSLIGLRYQLLPYVYTLMEEATRTGAPVMRPLAWEFPGDRRAEDRADSFMLGPALLVAPVRERGVQERSVYLPSGAWIDVWGGTRVAGPTTVVADAPLDRLPLFVRAGSIVPYETVRQHTGERGDGVLRLLVAPSADGSAAGRLYADAGEGFAYREGEYLAARFTREGAAVRVERATGGRHPELRWDRVAAVAAGEGFPVERGEEVAFDAGSVPFGAPE